MTPRKLGLGSWTALARRPGALAICSPAAMLASACAAHPLEPSSPADAFDSASRAYGEVGVVLPARADALRRWQLPDSDAWASYAKYTLLTALDDGPRMATLPMVDSLEDVMQARAAGEQVGAAGLPPETMWIVDMRGAASIAFGVALSHAVAGTSVSLVPTFNNWPGINEVIPAEETLAALATAWPRVSEDGGAQPVFLLDSWRLAFRDDEPQDDAYDNRYALSSTDFPDVGALVTHGVRRIVYVVESLKESEVEEDDLHGAFVAWSHAGFDLAMVDLDLLSQPGVGGRWDELLARHSLTVEPRLTILDDPAFYVRAHGGFGGFHARRAPGIVRVGGGHRGGHGGHGAGS